MTPAQKAWAQATEELTDLENMANQQKLREAMARAICDAKRWPGCYDKITLEAEKDTFRIMADAAIALMQTVYRAEVLEEAAKEAECVVAYGTSHEIMRENIAAAIRALITPGSGS